MAKRKPQPELHYIFNDPNTPEQWEKFFANRVTDKVIEIVSKYPPEFAKIVGHKLIELICKDKDKIINFALSDTSKIKSELDLLVNEILNME